MKCPNCGSNLSIDDERCSFCGADNSFAKKHRSQMRHFTREFNKTKAINDDALNKTKVQEIDLNKTKNWVRKKKERKEKGTCNN